MSIKNYRLFTQGNPDPGSPQESALVVWDAILEGRAVDRSFLREILKDFTDSEMLCLAAEICAYRELPIWIGPSPITSNKNPNFEKLSWRASTTTIKAMLCGRRTMSAMSIPALGGGVGMPDVAITLGSPEGASIVIRSRPSMLHYTYFGIGRYEYAHDIEVRAHQGPLDIAERQWVVTAFARSIILDRAHRVARSIHG